VAPVMEARRATTTIPIVSEALADPNQLRELGLARSMNLPGGNVTGVMNNLEGLPGKRLQLLAELDPKATRAGFLDNVSNTTSGPQRKEVEDAAVKLGLTLVAAEVRTPDDLEGAFQFLARARVAVMVIPTDVMFIAQRRKLAELAAAARIATIAGVRQYAADGHLMTYGVSLTENFRRVAYFVDRIFRGDKPGELPIEFPTKVEMIINMTTAKALGLTLPETILLRADEFIE
jgi:putative tryptophan/tyrosine transport system substrate-binding protein